MDIPKTVGISDGFQLYRDTDAGAPLKQFKGGSSLCALQRDYALFTYAPLFLYGGLSINPVNEWVNVQDRPSVVYRLDLPTPVFDMKMGVKFDCMLWAVEKEYWPSLSLHIGSLALIDKSKKRLTRVIHQDIPILDINKFDISATTVPTATISTFSVDSNHECIAFAPPKDFLTNRVILKRYNPREETVKMAEALFAESDNPYKDIQPFPWEIENEADTTPAQGV